MTQIGIWDQVDIGGSVWPDGDTWRWAAWRGYERCEGESDSPDEARAARDDAWMRLAARA